jgi:hypothetical protein
MSETEYTVTVDRLRRIAGRMNSGGYTAQIASPDGFELTSPQFDSDEQARNWATRYIEAKTAGLIKARPQPSVPAAPRIVPQMDRQATRVANLAGLPAPKATGRCHYCGLPLTNGHCEECI